MSQGGALLVTGASGFVGSALLREARSRNRRALGLVRTGTADERTRVLGEWSVESLSSLLAHDEIDAVVHCASVVHRVDAPRSEYVAFNVDATRALLAACRARGVRRLVYLSTIKVYGEAPNALMDESLPPAPEGPYAETKLEAEQLVVAAPEAGGPSTIALRLCPVYGVGDKGNIGKMIRAIARRRFLLPGDGRNRKSIVHVSTVADVALAAAESSATGAYVVADREAPTMRELSTAIARALGRRPPPSVPLALVEVAARGAELLARVVGRRPPSTRELIRKSLTTTVCSPRAVEAILGVTCHVDLGRALAEEVEWLGLASRG